MPAPLPEERISVPPAGGTGKPVRVAPVPWRMRPASAPGAGRSALSPQQSKEAAPSGPDKQTRVLFILTAIALVAVGALLVLRFLR
jgi:hypothetical protein